jgi:DNA-binding CsgD family transcriptional regulator
MREFDAWLIGEYRRVVRGLLEGDSDEMARRIARRRRRVVAGPPRELCLGVRASDRRIGPVNTEIEPRWAVEGTLEGGLRVMLEVARSTSSGQALAWGEGCGGRDGQPGKGAPRQPSGGGWRYLEHTVLLHAGLMEELCGGVVVGPEEHEVEVAKRLGVRRQTLMRARRRGVFEVRKFQGGKGQMEPLLSSNGAALDPCSGSLFRPPDPIWGSRWHWGAEAIPWGFSQRVWRVPVYVGIGGRREERVQGSGVGVQEEGGGTPAPKSTNERFMGWRWVCPGCGGRVRMLFYPLPRRTIPQFLGETFAENEADEARSPPGTFACAGCHGIKRAPIRAVRERWNEFISWVTDGLVYGHEIEMPKWMMKADRIRSRNRPYGKRVREEMTARQKEVLGMVMEGRSYREIGRELGIRREVVGGHVKKICRRYLVGSKRQLVELLRRGAVGVGEGERRVG